MFDIGPYLEVRPAPAAVFERAAETPDRVRFHTAAGDVTWADFADRVARVAAYLASLGVEPGDRAAVFADNSVDWAAAALGIQAIGAVMVPIYGSSTAAQAGYILDHSDARVVFTSADRRERVSGVEHTVVFGEASWAEVMAAPADVSAIAAGLDAIDLDAPAQMLYTSGSTGQPKGVPLTHNNVGLNARAWLESNQPDLHDGAVDVLWLPMSHIFGFGELCLGNTLGFETTLCSPAEALALLPEVRPTVFFSVPAYWEKLASRAGGSVAALRELTGGRLRFCLSGGAGLSREVKELFWEAGVLIVEGYGLTECSPTLTLNRRGEFRFDAVGKPLSNVELRLAGDGEIQARGPGVFAGYHKDPEATRAAFTDDGWFCTGDLGRFTDDGFLQIIGRKKEILVTAGGKNVPPANIEMRFADDPDIDQVVVYGDGKKYLVAAVWLAPGSTAGEAEIAARIEAVNAGLARYETIKKFRIIDRPLTVEDGFLTASLKLRRDQVYQTFGPELETLYS